VAGSDVDGVAQSLPDDRRTGVRFLACLLVFFKIASRLAMGPTETAVQCVPGVHLLVKLAGVWSYISTPATSSWPGD